MTGMERMSPLPLASLCISLAAIVSLSMTFTIDVDNTKRFRKNTNETGYFGYRALQYMNGTEKWIIASAPMFRNGTGRIYKCSPTNTSCEPFHMEEMNTTKSTGIALDIRSTSPTRITTCSPSLFHECDGNSYLNGICYHSTDNFNFGGSFKTAYQECTKREVDLAFLFDGSESLKADDFKKNKDFIADIMKTLSNTSIQFAAMQFSKTSRTVFTFKDYQEKKALDLLEKEQHMKDLTNTYGAMKNVLETILNSTTAGAIPDATKVLVIITDGNPSDKDWKKVVKAMDDRNITRYVIGVGNVARETLTALSSHLPNKNTTFPINDYNGLKGILDSLQKQIYNIEGTQNERGREFKHEMSQSGFSAVYLKDTLILGSVGSYNWKGSLIEVANESDYNEIVDDKMKEDSYMGYSVAVGKKANKSLYFSGAPRFQHMGQVLLFLKANEHWEVKQRKYGSQIGEYFGAELCAVDIDSDDETDFILVGAPLYHESHREGRMFVYQLTRELMMEEKASITVASQGRFASSISSLEDLNGDGLRDVAVGAPLEGDQKGAVYIYLGDRQRGIRLEYCQRIAAQEVSSGLRFFGQSIDGRMDLGEDGLTDIIVGAYEEVVLFRSRPVVNVSAQLYFSKPQISTDRFICQEKENILTVGALAVCFVVKNALNNATGSTDLGLTVSYQLDLDSVRQKSRAFLKSSDKGSRKNHSSLQLKLGQTCLNYSLYMPDCVKDTVSPMTIKLNFSQSDSPQHIHNTVLNTDSKNVTLIEVPFEKNCKGNETCISQLELDVNSTTSTLLVVDQDYFNVTGKLFNHGDDSYNTSITFRYPPGLSFSKMEVEEATRRTLISCSGLEGQNDTFCTVSLPVYPSKAYALFCSSFLISDRFNWSDSMEIVIVAQSANGNSTVRKISLPVQFAVDLAVKGQDEASVTYLNFSLEDTEPKTLKHVFEVKNLGFKSLPVTVNFIFPTQLEYNFIMENIITSVSENLTRCGNISDQKTQDCSKEHCKIIECNKFPLRQRSSVLFNLSWRVSFVNKTLIPRKPFSFESLEVQFSSWVNLSYDKNRYVQTVSTSEDQDPTKFHKAKIDCRVELIIPPNKIVICGVGAGGGFLVLVIIFAILWRLGFFKRKRPPSLSANDEMNADSMVLFNSEDEKENQKKDASEEDPSCDTKADYSAI
ncbi:integrin alpha-M-like isoform X1 [Anguilla rostrata]|uniref:integrin alpha-M-like isoform X1 n=1 Tax=Anguilla rostrata TaxID=7938 RepID=UPI0030D3B7F6